MTLATITCSMCGATIDPSDVDRDDVAGDWSPATRRLAAVVDHHEDHHPDSGLAQGDALFRPAGDR